MNPDHKIVSSDPLPPTKPRIFPDAGKGEYVLVDEMARYLRQMYEEHKVKEMIGEEESPSGVIKSILHGINRRLIKGPLP